ncbi:putative dye-decolorizing peroxidase (DyP), YfeX-like subgroup [Marinobacterium lacunae]|uniref:Putative dye-decolorizing peroxidase (DyP), YfeX-like subgroup n=1 Tax=Marinobacterium lacunae TaxID=1232683 RepID=A0A081G4Q7_9GAMM|nr:Dyp-type peroxidase [Marinobacterium lacunae]KEA65762.1 putative dye-decolorizing peroxidase (DyP), YfeX-like subgroup [Marinobacterium lacunae]
MTQDYQSGVIAEQNRDAIFLSFNQTHQPDAQARVKQVLSGLPQRVELLRNQLPDVALHLTVGIGSAYWDSLSPDSRPALLRGFPALEQGGRVAPSTPTDLLFIVRADQYDACFELAREIAEGLQGAAELVEEVHGFRYLDARDLTGFVDGTENPQGDDRLEVALVGDEDPDFAGGSYLHLQRYEHDLSAWNRQSLKEQEDAYGRTKVDNIEYPSAEKSPHAHTKRTSLKRPDGSSIEILRQSMPYGDSTRKGLMFVSVCRTPENFELMLKSMVEGDESGQADRILEFTRAVTGASFFVPAPSWLKRLA